MSKRITMADVAREVGVSLMTISRVINQKGEVSPPTRERVLAAVDRLGYRPSGIARSLATHHTGTLGLVVPDIANPFFAEIARGVDHAARAAGYIVFLCNTEEDPQRELDSLSSLEEKRVDGIVLCSSRLQAEDLRVVVEDYPAVVLVNRRVDIDGMNAGYVMVDDVMGGRIATRHLLSRGHREIGFLSGPEGSHSGQQRVRGYRQELLSAAGNPGPGLVQVCAPNAEGGHDGALALLALHPALTALLCYNDLVAVGALRACQESGLAVPQRIAVVGFDDIPLASLVVPPLTTCRVPRYELGVQAVQLLLHQMDAEGAGAQEIILQPELVIRASAP